MRRRYTAELEALPGESERHDRLCELNVIEQVANVSQTTIVRGAWARYQPLSIHGWIYCVSNGLLRNHGLCVSDESELSSSHEAALRGILEQFQV